MNPLLRHVARLVFAHDALAIARGTGWERLYVRQTCPGGGGGDVAYRSGSKAITITRSPMWSTHLRITDAGRRELEG